VTGYQVERCQGTGCTTFALVTTVTTTSFNNTGLTASTTYRYRVRATDAAGNFGAYTAIATATTQAPAADTTAPSRPGNVTATAVSPTQINLTWGASTDNVGVTGYQVQRCTGTNCNNYALVATVPTNSFNNTGLTPSTTYRYRVRATDAAGNLSSFTTPVVSASTPAQQDTTSPSAPGAATATAVSANQINLSWGAATDNVGVTGYQVERCTGAGCTTFALVTTVTTTSFNNTGLAASTTYVYRVRATDAAGNFGAYTAIATATTPAAAAVAIRVNAGGPAYTDSAGNLWSADTGFNIGNPLSWPTNLAIAGTSDPTLYRTERWDAPTAPAMTYSFTVPNGTYQVRLHFAENYAPLFNVGQRVFDVQIEGIVAIDNLDIFAAAGANTALIRSVTATVTDGQINIAFIHGVEDPEINAIEVLSTTP
jgi:predicted phage tail protein